jgi:hypothetical protein
LEETSFWGEGAAEMLEFGYMIKEALEKLNDAG